MQLYRTEGSTPVFLAASGSYLLGSNDHDTLTATLDRARAGAAAPAGLAATPRYRATIARLPLAVFVYAFGSVTTAT